MIKGLATRKYNVKTWITISRYLKVGGELNIHDPTSKLYLLNKAHSIKSLLFSSHECSFVYLQFDEESAGTVSTLNYQAPDITFITYNRLANPPTLFVFLSCIGLATSPSLANFFWKALNSGVEPWAPNASLFAYLGTHISVAQTHFQFIPSE